MKPLYLSTIIVALSSFYIFGSTTTILADAQKNVSNSIEIDTLFDTAETLYSQKKYDEALPYFDQVLSINASDVYAINNKAEALAEMGKNKEALSVIEKAAIDNPNDEYLQSTIAYILANMGKDNEARVYYDKALKINSNLTEILYDKELDVFNKIMGDKTTE